MAQMPEAVLEETVHRMADGIAELAPLTIRAAKLAIDQRDGAAEACEGCYGSADYAEGVAAFVQKRLPRFLGR
jgi:enoyl-CoA hydratase/carnithine racemase